MILLFLLISINRLPPPPLSCSFTLSSFFSLSPTYFIWFYFRNFISFNLTALLLIPLPFLITSSSLHLRFLLFLLFLMSSF